MKDKPKDSKVLRPARTGSLSRRDAVRAVKAACAKQKTNIKSGKNSWYEQITSRCPVCLSEQYSRVRHYTPKPSDPHKIYIQEECYDWCEN